MIDFVTLFFTIVGFILVCFGAVMVLTFCIFMGCIISLYFLSFVWFIVTYPDKKIIEKFEGVGKK